MNWVLLYTLAGFAIATQATTKGSNKKIFSVYAFCVIAWPLILLIMIIDSVKRGRKG